MGRRILLRKKENLKCVGACRGAGAMDESQNRIWVYIVRVRVSCVERERERETRVAQEKKREKA